MANRPFDPLRLDVDAFAREAATLAGDWPLASLTRLADMAAPGRGPADGDRVRFLAEGECRNARAGAPEVGLHVEATTEIVLQCQRCLEPVATALAVDRRFGFAADEDTAARLDADGEDDVLALTGALDLRDLVEDELILALPLVPRHAVCPNPLPSPDEPAADGGRAPHPFAVLAQLKRGDAGH